LVDLSICIVSWNIKPLLRRCLESIGEGAVGISYEVFVVDNASRDGSAEMVRNDFPEVHLISNSENRGFASANNQALRLAGGRHVILLNPDTVIHRGSLDTLVQFMDDHPEAGAAGCRLLNADGSVQRSTRKIPTFSTMLYDNTLLGKLFYFRRKVKDYKMRDSSFDRVEEVDATSGAALLVRKSVFDEIGLMDEGYFMFLEEVDLCRRIWAKGYKIYFVPGAVITHLGGESRRQNPEIRLVIQRSLMRYFTKIEGPGKTRLFKLLYKPLFIMSLLYGLVFDLLYVLKYLTIKKDLLRWKKRITRVHETFYFFRKNLKDFLFNL